MVLSSEVEMLCNSNARCSRRELVRMGLLIGMLGEVGCGEQVASTAPPPAPGGTGNRARLAKFKENAESGLRSKKR
jgi:hypothetical protein